MIKNYLKIGFRNLSRNKVFSAINICGLALGIATININLWVFALAALLAAGITLITVGFRAIRAPVANPVNRLRSE